MIDSLSTAHRSLAATILVASALLGASTAKSEDSICRPDYSRTGWGESIGLRHSEGVDDLGWIADIRSDTLGSGTRTVPASTSDRGLDSVDR